VKQTHGNEAQQPNQHGKHSGNRAHSLRPSVNNVQGSGSGIYNGLQPHITAAYPGRTLPRSARARGLISQSFLISIRIAPLMCSDHYPELNLLRSPVGRCFRLIIVTGW
tara:strand:+ start:218 stop:544 length:327 start_codon:yes stop_codon:yes gene_type:complete